MRAKTPPSSRDGRSKRLKPRSRHKRNCSHPLPEDKVRALRRGEEVWATVIDPAVGQLVRARFTGDMDQMLLDQCSLVYIQHRNYQGPATILKDGLIMLADGRTIRAEGSYLNAMIGEAKETHSREVSDA